MSKYQILDGSLDWQDGSVGTCLEGHQNVKYLCGDFLAAMKAGKEVGILKLGEVISWQRELLEAGEPAVLKYTNSAFDIT